MSKGKRTSCAFQVLYLAANATQMKALAWFGPCLADSLCRVRSVAGFEG